MIAKTLYSSVIRERAEAEPLNWRSERQQVSEQQVRALWSEAKDILIVSQRTPRGYLTVASPSLASIVGAAQVRVRARVRVSLTLTLTLTLTLPLTLTLRLPLPLPLPLTLPLPLPLPLLRPPSGRRASSTRTSTRTRRR